jgi:integrase
MAVIDISRSFTRRRRLALGVATLIDDSGLSARIGADQLGHARPSMTQDVYMSRGQVHSEVAEVLDRASGINDG